MKQPTTELTTHPSLLLRLRNREDVSAWTEFVRVYGPIIFGYCRLKQLQESDAADVSQEVLIRLSKCIGSFDYRPELGRFRDWLGKVTHRELLRFWNRRKLNREVIFEGSDLEPLPASEVAVWIDHFQSEILRLSLQNIQSEFEPETWNAFEGSWLNSMEPADVASQLQIGIEKVYVAKSRVLKRLCAEVKRLSEDLPVADG